MRPRMHAPDLLPQGDHAGMLGSHVRSHCVRGVAYGGGGLYGDSDTRLDDGAVPPSACGAVSCPVWVRGSAGHGQGCSQCDAIGCHALCADYACARVCLSCAWRQVFSAALQGGGSGAAPTFAFSVPPPVVEDPVESGKEMVGNLVLMDWCAGVHVVPLGSAAVLRPPFPRSPCRLNALRPPGPAVLHFCLGRCKLSTPSSAPPPRPPSFPRPDPQPAPRSPPMPLPSPSPVRLRAGGGAGWGPAPYRLQYMYGHDQLAGVHGRRRAA
jgi:hypothetical protein